MNPDTSAPRADYIEPRVVTWVARRAKLPLRPDIQTNAKRSASLASGEALPVVLFSPGLFMTAELYSSLLEELASRGFVVIAVDHPYVSGLTELPDGRAIESALTDGNPQAAQMVVDDLRFVLDWLHGQAAQEIDADLRKHLDLTRIGAVGHSFGGSAALQSTRQDERLRAALDLDGTILGELDVAWTKPMMFLNSEEHLLSADPKLQRVWEQHSGPGFLELLPGAGHLDFSDLKLLLDPAAGSVASDMLMSAGLGPVSASEALTWTRERMVGFLDTQLAPAAGQPARQARHSGARRSELPSDR